VRISLHRSVIILLGTLSALLAQNLSRVPDVRQIVESSTAATQRSWQERLHYTYVTREESLRRGPDGPVQSQDVDVSKTILVNGIPFEQLVEHNGQPLSAEEERKQKEDLDKLKRETPAQRAGRLRKEADENTSLIGQVPKAFDFQLAGEDVVEGRPAYVLQATPHPGYQAQGKYGKMFSRVKGRLWVDKQDLGWIKVDAQVIQPFSMGFFLARVQPGSHITMEQTRVDDGMWMPKLIQVRAAAKIFFLKNLAIEKVLRYSEYARSQPATTKMVK
jgi:hypothetical protein